MLNKWQYTTQNQKETLRTVQPPMLRWNLAIIMDVHLHAPKHCFGPVLNTSSLPIQIQIQPFAAKVSKY